MPNKPIIEIDVDDSKFQAFLQSFENYKKSLDDLSGEWRNVATSIDQGGDALEDHVASVEAMGEALRRLTETSKRAGRLWAGGASDFREMAKHGESLNKSVLGISRNLLVLSRGGALGMLAGLAGLGALGFGLDEIMRDAVSGRNQAARVSAKSRNVQALSAGFQSLDWDVPSILGKIAAAQAERSPAAAAFGIVGMGRTQAFETLVRAMLKHDARYKKSIVGMAQDPVVRYAEALGLSLPMQQQMAQHPGDIEAALKASHQVEQATPKGLDEAQKKWQEVDRQLDAAGRAIKQNLTVALAPIGPALVTLSAEAVSLTQSFAKFVMWLEKKYPQVAATAGGAAAGAAAGAVGGAAVGFVVGGPAGAAVGAGIGAVAGAVGGAEAGSVASATDRNREWNTALRAWERARGLGQDHRTFSQFKADFDRTHPLPPPGSVSPQSSLGRKIKAMTQAGSGSVAAQIVAEAKARGASTAATTALIAGALGEGGIWQPWKPGDFRNGVPTSFGMWQLHAGGELDRYIAEGGQAGNVQQQTAYVLRRLNEMYPGFSKITDPNVAIADVAGFERSVQGVGYYASHLPAAAQVVAGLKTAIKHTAPTAPAAQKPSSSSALVAGGAVKKALHPVTAATKSSNKVQVNVSSDASANSVISISQLPF